MTYNPNTGGQRRSKPFEPETDYVKVHRAIYDLYTRIPGFTADHALMYVVLMDYYRTDYGYAFPTQWQLAHRLNCGENKPGQLRKVLEACGLVRCETSRVGDNLIYRVFAPITDEAAFYERFPEAREYYNKREQQFRARSERKRKGDRKLTEETGMTFTDGTPFTLDDL